MKSVQKFKNLLEKKRPEALSGALGVGVRKLHPSLSLDGETEPELHKSRSMDIHDRRTIETALAAEGVHHDIQTPESVLRPSTNKIDSSVFIVDGPKSNSQSSISRPDPKKISVESIPHSPRRGESGEKGHAHNPLDEEPLFLGVGTGGWDDNSLEPPPRDIVAESPTAAEFSIYDTAYQQEVERIRANQGHSATVYLTRRVDNKKEYKADENMIDAPTQGEVEGMPHEGWKGLLDKARDNQDHIVQPNKSVEKKTSMSNNFSSVAAQAVENTKIIATKGSGLMASIVGKIGNSK